MKKVITYGTFDMFHEGHYNILKRAREYGDYLIVAVTGENYDIGRGKLSVKDSLAERIENVRKTGLADKIIVEEYLGQKIGDIVKYEVDYLVIGDDWKGKFDHLSRYCTIVYLERTDGISSTQLREEIFTKYDIGVITDIVDDNQIIKDSKEVSGFNVVSVYSDDEETAKAFSEKYGVERKKTLRELIDASDIVYIRMALKSRAELIRDALEQGKHVICDSPFTISGEEEKALFKLAEKKNVILMENIKMVHIHVFNQLLWMTQGGLIGDILNFNCSISRNDKSRKNLFYDLTSLALVPMLKIMGFDYDKADINVKVEGDNIEYASLNFVYKNSRAVLNIGDKIRVKNQIEIIGTKGTVRMYENWWRGNYFEIDKPEADMVEVYNTNFSGNGFKYLIKAMAIMLTGKRYVSMGVFRDESEKIAEISELIKTEAEREKNR